MRCTPKIKIASLAHEREKFFAKCRQIVYCVTNTFAEKSLATQFCKVCNYVGTQQLLQREMLSGPNTTLGLLLDVVVIFSKRNIKVQHVQQSLVIKKLNADLQLQADFAFLHSYNTKADYSPYSDCSATQSRN